MADVVMFGKPGTNADTNGAARPIESRRRLLDLTVGLVEDLRRSPMPAEKGPEGFCSDFQVCLPYRGLFVWHVEKEEVIGDPNQIVFVRGGEAYRMSSLSEGGYAELVVTPDIEILAELAQLNSRRLFEHALFRRRRVRAAPQLQAARARLLHYSTGGSAWECLEAEEILVAMLRSALQQDVGHLKTTTGASARLIRRTKEVLSDRVAERWRLLDIARVVGASPAYLTDLFTKFEGVSLHQYLTQLRLSRALMELPHVNDLTELALELGFSSHSHFTFAFRRAFGCTPSAFRERTRREAGRHLS
jgi:AraC family transcriptional regulator